MSDVTRYDCTTGVEGTPEMDPFSHGDWVPFDDYENLEAENAKLRAELAEKYSTESHAIAATLGKENLRLQAERDALKGKIARLEEGYDIIAAGMTALEAEVEALRRSIDNVKVRAYELGQKELHDMALAALLEEDK